MHKVIILGNYMRHFYYFDLYFLSVVYCGRFLPYTKQLLVLFHAHIGTEINTVKKHSFYACHPHIFYSEFKFILPSIHIRVIICALSD
jgi:hypothetical protein